MQQVVFFTKQGFQKIADELAEKQKERPAIVSRLQLAREQGDLSENGAYKAARFELSSIDSRIRHLQLLISRSKVIEKHMNGQVGFANTVVVSCDGKKIEYTLVGPHESNPAEKTISIESPIGKALLGKRVGEYVGVQIPAGEKIFLIESIQ